MMKMCAQRIPGGRLACGPEDIGVAQMADRDAQVMHAHINVALLACILAVCKAQVLGRACHLLRCADTFNSLFEHQQVLNT